MSCFSSLFAHGDPEIKGVSGDGAGSFSLVIINVTRLKHVNWNISKKHAAITNRKENRLIITIIGISTMLEITHIQTFR